MLPWLMRRTAAKAPGSDPEDPVGEGLAEESAPLRQDGDGARLTRGTVLLIALWYASASLAVVTSKAALMATQAPTLLSLTQALGASVLCLGLALCEGLPLTVPKAARGLVLRIGAVYSLGFYLTNVSLMVGNASFTETVKASEPVASVALAAALLGDVPSRRMLMSIGVLMGGTALSCVGEGTMFSGLGLLAALAANVMFALRSVFTKQLKQEPGAAGKLSPKVLFLYVSLAGVCFNLPSYLISSEPSVVAVIAGIDDTAFFRHVAFGMAVNALCYATYNLSSFLVLERMSVTGHAVFNVFRRVFIIGATMTAFGVRPTMLGVAGIGLSATGFSMYILR